MSNMPEMFTVSSSNVDRIGYNVDSSELYVKFLNGTMYVYKNVPQIEFDNLMQAPSIGSYLNRNIKGAYAYERIE